MDARNEMEDEQIEYDSSEEEVEVLQDGYPAFLKHLDFLKCLEETTENLQKHTHREPTLIIPQMKISNTTRNQPSVYLVPPIYMWDPACVGVKVTCPGGDHRMHKNQWKDCLAYHFHSPIYIRRHFLKCQKILNFCFRSFFPSCLGGMPPLWEIVSRQR